jgi:O-antigen/teichoic acid export membrane protein
VDVVPQALITAAAWPLAVWLGDYRVIVILMIAKAVTGTILSHALAQRRYRWAWDREYVRGMLTFGWPLLLTGFVIFGSQQLDQMLVGAVFSLNALANYALAASLVSIPWYIYSQVAGSVMLPVMARAQDDLERFRRQYRRCAQTAAVAGIIPALTLIIVGEQLITLLYGAKYQGSGVFVALLGTASALRFLRFAPTVASSAKGDTINHLYSNLWRISSLPLALLVVALNGTPVQIAGCAIVGELLAVTAAMVRLSRNGVPLRESLGGGIYLVTTLAVGVALSFACASWSIYAVAGLAAGCLVVALGVAWLMFPEIVSFVSGALKRTPDPSLATR